METIVNSQQTSHKKATTEETNNQYHYTFTPSQLESLKKNV